MKNKNKNKKNKNKKVNYQYDRHQTICQKWKKKEFETLIEVVRIYSEYIGIEFIIEKCAMLIMKSGKRQMWEGIELPNEKKNQNAQRKGSL